MPKSLTSNAQVFIPITSNASQWGRAATPNYEYITQLVFPEPQSMQEVYAMSKVLSYQASLIILDEGRVDRCQVNVANCSVHGIYV